ncbi:hypothetical protein [Bacillus ndiopicus]|uniref:hypothetical protein n=1 Tax=Bacillus ndiopicus TaxID=1347368 RepID=UPI0005A9F64F|nr:hypothetical protein [Bacillus ndiopicus]
MPIDLKVLPSYENGSRGYIGWGPGWDYLTGKSNYNSNIRFKTWSDFNDAWGNINIDFNDVLIMKMGVFRDAFLLLKI